MKMGRSSVSLTGNGESIKRRGTESHRAFTTTQAEAFAAPLALYQGSTFLAGDNSLTPDEQLLIKAYEERDRFDLADCVRGGKKYQRLLQVVAENEAPSYATVLALRHAFSDGGSQGMEKESEDDWKSRMLRVHEADEGLRRVLEGQ